MTATQNSEVLKHLKRHGKINPLQALEKYGIFRLGARVFDLKQAGHEIESQLVVVQNRKGMAVRVAEYRIRKGGTS